MDANLIKGYRHQRAIGFRAGQALRNARVIEAWNDLGGEFVDEYDADDEPGTVRIRLVASDEAYDDSYLDTWGMSEGELAKERKRLWDSIEAGGVWGMVAEYWTGDEWEHVDSCWGFIGDDWRNSGYDTDLMRSAMDAYSEALVAQAAALEATRPDMYA